MEYRRLGRTDLYVSSIGLGCATFGREIDQATSFAVMDRALERGINLIDTAESYAEGRSEEIVGHWLADRGVRERVVLATKVHGRLTRQRVLTSAEASLRRLQTDRVDLFQVHNWDAETPLEETLEALHMLVEQDKARYIGCSNYAAWQLCKALWRQDVNGWTRLESVQPNYNLIVRDIERGMLSLCADQEVGVITYSPLGGGFLTGKYRQGNGIPTGTRMDVVPLMQEIYFHEVGFRVMEGLRAKAAELGSTMVLLALAWAMGQPGITSVLAGARSVDQVDQAFQAQAMNMPPELRAELSAL
jgi:aryl-alcohol dehydrogenase-like predicted oxidoreductase